MKTPSGKFSAVLATVCLSSMTFYLGAQMVTDTKASFSDAAKQSVHFSAAFVFPKTIEELQKKAEALGGEITSRYQAIMSTEENLTLEQATSKLKELEQEKEALQEKKAAFQAVYEELKGYYSQAVQNAAQEQGQPKQENISNEIDYVKPAFESVDALHQQLSAAVDMGKADAAILKLQEEISELSIKEQPAEETEPAAPAAPAAGETEPASGKTEPATEGAEPAAQETDAGASVHTAS